MPRKRTLSAFFSKELLYEYYKGQTNSGATQALKENLDKDDSLKAELQKLDKAFKYTEQLTESNFKDEIDSIESEINNSFFRKILEFNNYSSGTKTLIQGITIALLVFIVGRNLPWDAMNDGEIHSQKSTPINADLETSLKQTTETTIPVKEAENIEPTTNTETKPKIETKTVEVKEKTPDPKTNPTDQPEDKLIMNGSLLRAKFLASDIEETTNTLVKWLTDLDSKKGGQVPIGWRKTNGSYFHFIITNKAFEDFKNKLQAYGPVQFQKFPHQRVMPNGKVRVILWVEDKNYDPDKQQDNEP